MLTNRRGRASGPKPSLPVKGKNLTAEKLSKKTTPSGSKPETPSHLGQKALSRRGQSETKKKSTARRSARVAKSQAKPRHVMN
jgi:hypothetical protein